MPWHASKRPRCTCLRPARHAGRRSLTAVVHSKPARLRWCHRRDSRNVRRTLLFAYRCSFRRVASKVLGALCMPRPRTHCRQTLACSCHCTHEPSCIRAVEGGLPLRDASPLSISIQKWGVSCEEIRHGSMQRPPSSSRAAASSAWLCAATDDRQQDWSCRLLSGCAVHHVTRQTYGGVGCNRRVGWPNVLGCYASWPSERGG